MRVRLSEAHPNPPSAVASLRRSHPALGRTGPPIKEYDHVSSPENTDTIEDVTVPKMPVRRSRRSLRVMGCLVALVALAFANSACTPEATAKDAIKKYWGNYSACAEKIVARESGFNAAAVNPSGATGLFQLMRSAHEGWIKAELGYDWSEMKDPYKNSRAAKLLSSKAYAQTNDGWQPWRLGGRVAPNGGCPA